MHSYKSTKKIYIVGVRQKCQWIN